MTKALLLATVAGFCTTPLMAQEVINPVQQGSVDQDEPQVVPPQDTGAPPIIITAQGRQQLLTDVPIAVNVVSGEQLQNSGANDIRELTQVSPSLLVSSTGTEANGSARIRGVGTVGDNPGLESSVAVFVDGVYRSRSGSALGDLGPIDRVEVLRGPQGTLFGRNASAGLLNIVTAQPDLTRLTAYGVASYGNYDYLRLEGGVNAPVGDTIAVRVDGTYTERDGFYRDITNNTRVNDRDRYLVRGKALWEPTPDARILLSADYSRKTEACCAATFVQPDFAPGATIAPGLNSFAPPSGGPALTSTANPIVPILLALGQDPRALTQSTFNRDIYNTPGRSFDGLTEDYGVSGQIEYDFGGVNLTSVTGYREYKNNQGSDTDYTTVDILYRAPGNFAGAREFKTFSQELRFNGSLFNDRLDWLVGGYYSNEDLTVRDNLRFGTQYGRYATCRLAVTFAGLTPLFAGLTSPTSPGCLNARAPAQLGLIGPAGQALFAAFQTLDQINDRGGTGDVYRQNSENYAFFTHNIIHVTDTLDLTLGLRYTNEKKEFDATFGNDNIFCPRNRALLQPLLSSSLGAIAGGLISLSCQGNSTVELNGLTPSDERKEDEFTGTAVVSWKPRPELLFYGSYSRGYKAGGFNLDRSALTGTSSTGILLGPIVAGNTANLQFDQETVNAFEVGAKYSIRPLTLTAAVYRQEFSNFQLNTFNGSVFLVQNINGCDTDLGGLDRDASATTGACGSDDVKAGVIAQGVELEASIDPVRYLNATLGFTYTDTSFEDNLVGRDTGAPLDPALRLLPGDNLSNAPQVTTTASVTYTPPLGDSGYSGLLYANARSVSDYNTGSDLLPGKEQDGFVVVNARIGLRTPGQRFAIEGFVQNLFDKDYTQIAFNTPFVAPQQTYSAFLAEPRTYGVTVRASF